MNKNGDVWISAVIYIGLGIVLLSIILAAGLPVIDRMRDTYTAKQTKEIMLTVDQNIRSVYNQGPGAQTQVKLRINKGEFIIDQDNEIISWSTRTKAILSEPNIVVNEGNLQIETSDSPQKGEYILTLSLSYSEADLTYDGGILKGTNILVITNKGNGEIKLTKIT
jgi:type II secretory pathway pseudopilin PulG